MDDIWVVEHGGVVLHLVEINPLGDGALEQGKIEGDVVDVGFLECSGKNAGTPSMKN